MKTNTLGTIGCLCILAFIAVTVGTYRHAFSDAETVTVAAPRAGLLLDPGTHVRLRGVVVGEVRSVAPTANGAAITVALDADQIAHVPADVTASVTPSTVFGGKYIELTDGTSAQAIAAGATIPATSVTPEIDDLFGLTQDLLQAIPIDKLSVVLSTVANALDGRGEQLGELITSFAGYLRTINGTADALSADLALAPDVLKAYAGITPDLLKTIKHATVTAKTITVREDDFDDLIDAGRRTVRTGTTFLNANSAPLLGTLKNARPVTGLLARYSPIFPCTLTAWSNLAVNNHALGDTYPGAQAIMTLLPGQHGYQYPRDLPRFVDNRGPNCYGLPKIGGKPPRQKLNDGQHAYDGDTNQVLPGNPLLRFFDDEKLP